MAAHRNWWSRVYTNEIFLIVPCLTWWKLRKTREQRIADIARTVPLIVVAIVAAAENAWPSTPALVAVAAWTVLANIAMAIIDRMVEEKDEHKKLFEFDGKAEILFAALTVSPLSIVAGSPAWLTGLPKGTGWYITATLNVGLILYIVAEAMLAAPYTDAWACYPPPRRLAELKYGYCPQKTGSIEPYNACVYIGDQTEACNPDTWSTRKRDLAAQVSIVAHTAARVLAVSFSSFVADIPLCVYRMREKVCKKSR